MGELAKYTMEEGLESDEIDSAPSGGILDPETIEYSSQRSRLVGILAIINRSTTRQLLSFGAVGILNTVVDLFTLNVLIFLEPEGSRGMLFSLFKTLAFLAANLNSYILNRHFTFQSRKKTSAGQVSQFVAISVGGLLINVTAATVMLHSFMAPPMLEPYWPSLAALCGIPLGLLWNFIGYRFLVFRS